MYTLNFWSFFSPPIALSIIHIYHLLLRSYLAEFLLYLDLAND